MRITTAWASICSQNVVLRGTVVALTLTSIGLGITSTQLALRDPIVIERGCVSTAATLGSTKRTELEIRTFIDKALFDRFDSAAPNNSPFVSEAERVNRAKEQDELKARGMSQRVLTNTIKIESDKVTIDADRLISVGSIRSALPFPIVVALSSVDRSEANPYGLQIKNVSQGAPDVGKDKANEKAR